MATAEPGPRTASRRPPPMRKRPLQSRSRLTVLSVQQACLQLFRARPPERVTMAAVAARSGIVAGSIYQYFDGIESVIGSIYDHCLRGDPGQLDPAWAGGDREALLRRLDSLFSRSYHRDHYRHLLATQRVTRQLAPAAPVA